MATAGTTGATALGGDVPGGDHGPGNPGPGHPPSPGSAATSNRFGERNLDGTWPATADPRPEDDSTCLLDFGVGQGFDIGLGPRHRPSWHSAGIWGNFTWPLKPHTGCVKNQANRGSCFAFALAGAMEIEAHKKDGVFVDLSEQQAYYATKFYDNGGLPGDADGANTWDGMFHLTGQTLPYEFLWDYNPAYNRHDSAGKPDEDNMDPTHNYRWYGSCIGYTGQACSDTTPEGAQSCLAGFCWQNSPVASPYPGYRFNLGDFSELWNLSSCDHTDHWNDLKVAVQVHPVILSVLTDDAFMNHAVDGYVVAATPARGDCTDTPSALMATQGGHVIVAVGTAEAFQVNTRLPMAPVPAGRDYLIVRNSWGEGYGDNGYYYLDSEWVKKNVTSAIVLTDVHQDLGLPTANPPAGGGGTYCPRRYVLQAGTCQMATCALSGKVLNDLTKTCEAPPSCPERMAWRSNLANDMSGESDSCGCAPGLAQDGTDCVCAKADGTPDPTKAWDHNVRSCVAKSALTPQCGAGAHYVAATRACACANADLHLNAYNACVCNESNKAPIGGKCEKNGGLNQHIKD